MNSFKPSIRATTGAAELTALKGPSHGLQASAAGIAAPVPLEVVSSTPEIITVPGSGGTDQYHEVIAYGTGFLASWTRTVGSESSVVAQKYDANGDAVGNLMTIETAAQNVTGKPELIDLGGGKVGVFWRVGTDTQGAILNTGNGSLSNERAIVTNAADFMHDVVRLANGDIAMVTAKYDGQQADINLLVLNDTNLAQVSSKTLGTFAAPSNTYDHTVVSLGNGGVALYRNRDTNQLFAQKFTANGGLSGAELKVNTTKIELPTSFDTTYFEPQAVELTGGGYVVSWMNIEGSAGDRVEVRARMFDASGAPMGKDFLLNEAPAGNQYDAQLIALDNGGFAAFWVSDVGFSRETVIRYYDAAGKALTGEISTGNPSLFSTIVDHQLTQLSDGTILNLYAGGFFSGLYADGIKPPVFGGAAAETFSGTAGDDVILAGGGNDVVNAKQLGNEVINGGAGNDTLDFGNFFTQQDGVDGGDGQDTFKISGAAYSNLNFGDFAGIEVIALGAGFDYTLVHNDGMVANGKLLKIDGSKLGSGDTLIYFGNFEMNGRLDLNGGAGADVLYDGKGNDTIKGNGGGDTLNAGTGGNDKIFGGDGADRIEMSGFLTAQDQIDGGKGADTLFLAFDYSAGVTFTNATMKAVETVLLYSGYSYNLTTHNGNVAKNTALTVDGSTLVSFNVLTFNGAAETDGKFVITGGAGADVLTGGAKNDLISGGDGGDKLDGGAGADTLQAGLGFDTLTGGAGVDKFIYDAVTSLDYKTIQDVTRDDVIDVHLIDANTVAANDQAFIFIGTGEFTGVAGQLRLAVSGSTNVVVDRDGDGFGELTLFVLMGDAAPTLQASDFVL